MAAARSMLWVSIEAAVAPPAMVRNRRRSTLTTGGSLGRVRTAVSRPWSSPVNADAALGYRWATGYFFFALGGKVPTYAAAFSTQGAACSEVYAAGRLRNPPIGRSSGPNGPPPAAASASRSSAASLSPMSEPKSPANMLPFTNAPSWPNIGFTSAPATGATYSRNRSLSSSVALGIFMLSIVPGGASDVEDGSRWRSSSGRRSCPRRYSGNESGNQVVGDSDGNRDVHRHPSPQA